MMRDEQKILNRDEIRLDRVQVVWLTLGGLVSLSLVFALGVTVGRRAAAFSEPQVIANPVAVADERTDVHEKLTFYEQLTGPRQKTLEPTQTQLLASKATQAKRLDIEKPPGPKLVEQSPNLVAEPDVNSSPSSEKSISHEELPARLSNSQEDKDAGLGSIAEREQPRASKGSSRDSIPAGPAASGEYTIQVSAYQSMAEARAYTAALERKGFKPFIVTAHISGKGTWYRVRIGRYPNPAAAEIGKQILLEADIPAWVLRSF